MLKRYLETKNGQVHTRELGAAMVETKRPLLCLHPSPYSGLFFSTIMPLLNQNRRVLAPDYPGYGNSYPMDQPPTIADFGSAIVDGYRDEAEYDVLGFHTGCLVGVEIACSLLQKVKNLIIVDVPYYTGDAQKKMLDASAQPMVLNSDLSSLEKYWEFNVSSRVDFMDMNRCFELFLEHVKAGTKSHYGFHAAFNYDCESKFNQVPVPTTVVATKSMLLDATYECVNVLPRATLVEALEITTAVFETGAQTISQIVNNVLDDQS